MIITTLQFGAYAMKRYMVKAMENWLALIALCLIPWTATTIYADEHATTAGADIASKVIVQRFEYAIRSFSPLQGGNMLVIGTEEIDGAKDDGTLRIRMVSSGIIGIGGITVQFVRRGSITDLTGTERWAVEQATVISQNSGSDLIVLVLKPSE